MARIARVVLPDYPHHVTQRGNRRQLVFFSDEDYRTYRTMLAKACRMARTEDWPWSSASAQLVGADDALVRVAPMLERIACWQSYLEAGESVKRMDAMRLHTRTGRPLGGESFIDVAERIAGRAVRVGRPGRKRRETSG